MNRQTQSTAQCLIIDDEPVSRKILKSYISKLPWLSLTRSCQDAVKGLQSIKETSPDIIFLDINMPEISGLQLLQMMPGMGSSVIVTSAHQRYAIDGYDYDILSFLPKPVIYSDFLKAVTKAFFKKQQALQQKPSISLENPAQPALTGDYPIQTPHFDQEHLWIKFDRKLFAIPYQQIIFIENLHNYIAIHIIGRPLVKTRSSMSEIAGGLPDFFVRTHRSFIVNRHQVCSIEGNILHMADGYKVSIAKDERSETILCITTGTTRALTSR